MLPERHAGSSCGPWLWVADEFRYVFDDGDAIAYWESATILGAAGPVTKRIELGPLVVRSACAIPSCSRARRRT